MTMPRVHICRAIFKLVIAVNLLLPSPAMSGSPEVQPWLLQVLSHCVSAHRHLVPCCVLHGIRPAADRMEHTPGCAYVLYVVTTAAALSTRLFLQEQMH